MQQTEEEYYYSQLDDQMDPNHLNYMYYTPQADAYTQNLDLPFHSKPATNTIAQQAQPVQHAHYQSHSIVSSSYEVSGKNLNIFQDQTPIPKQAADDLCQDYPNTQQSLIDWVNSMNDPYCLLANGASDFKDGIIFCHLVGIVACSGEDQRKLRQLVCYQVNGDEQAMDKNLDLALNVLKASALPLPHQVQNIGVQDLLESDDKIYFLLEILKQTYEILTIDSCYPNAHAQTAASQLNLNQFPGTSTPSASHFNTYEVGSQIHKATNDNSFVTTAKKEFEMDAYGYSNDDITTCANNTNQRPVDICSESLNQRLTLTGPSPNYTAGSINQNANLPVQMAQNKKHKHKLPPMKPKIDASKHISPIQSQKRQQRDLLEPNSSLDQEEEMLKKQINVLDESFKRLEQQTTPNKMTATPQQSKKNNYTSATASVQQNSKENTQKRFPNNQSPVPMGRSQTPSVQPQQQRNQQKMKTSLISEIPKQHEDIYDQFHEFQLKQQESTIKSSITNQQLDNSVLQNPKTNASISNINKAITITNTEQAINDSTLTSKSMNKKAQSQSARDLPKQISKLQKPSRSRGYTPSSALLIRDQQQQEDNDDSIMNEMQQLQISPAKKEPTNLILEDIKVDPVDRKTQIKLLEWLISEIKLIKNTNNYESLIQQFPSYCRNGVLFFDLVNRLNGKHATIKGVERNPKTLSSIINNFSRVFDFYRQFPKFNSRYLWAQNHLIQGKDEVVWGFLDDIWYWFKDKISPFDPATNPQIQQQIMAESRLNKSKSPQRGSEKSQPRQFNNDSAAQVHQIPTTIALKQQLLIQQTAPINPKQQQQQQKSPLHSARQQERHSIQNIQKQQQKYFISDEYPKHVTISSNPFSATDNTNHNISQTIPSLKPTSYANMYSKSPRLRTPMNNNQNQSFDPSKHQFSNKSARRRHIERSAFKSTDPIARDSEGTLYYYNKQGATFDQKRTSMTNQPATPSGQYVHIKITPQIEAEIREWLFKLKFHSFLSNEFQHNEIIHDPYRNGILLCELFCYIHSIDLLNVIYKPNTVSECRENLQKVLSVIATKSPQVPTRLMTEQAIENILKGDKNTIYQLLYYIKEASAGIQPKQQQNDLMSLDMAPVATPTNAVLQIPYVENELRMLQISLLNWIKQLGILQVIGRDDLMGAECLIELQKEIQNGILLCELVQIMFNVKLTGIFKDPKTDTTCISNIRKGLEVLRTQKQMSQKFTWTEKELFQGKRLIMMGLLEDMHRCFDGLPPRQRGLNYFADGPYLGDTLYDCLSNNNNNNNGPLRQTRNQRNNQKIDSMEPVSFMNKNIAAQNSSTDNLFKVDVLKQEQSNQFQEVPSLFNQSKQSSQQQNLSPKAKPHQPVNFSNFLNLKLQRENEKTRSPSYKGRQSQDQILVQENKENLHTQNTNLQLNRDIQGMLKKPEKHNYDSRHLSSAAVEFEGKDHLKKPSSCSVDDFESEEHTHNKIVFNAREKQKILEWFGALHIQVPATFTLSAPDEIPEFKNGILLCHLVQTLEGTASIENIVPNPKSAASSQQNIKKALQVLKKKTQIPLYLLYSEEEIQKGNPEIIFQLLKSMRRAYRTKMQALEENKQKSVTRKSWHEKSDTTGQSTLHRSKEYCDPETNKDGWPLSPKDRKKLDIPKISIGKVIQRQINK